MCPGWKLEQKLAADPEALKAALQKYGDRILLFPASERRGVAALALALEKNAELRKSLGYAKEESPAMVRAVLDRFSRTSCGASP